MKKQLKKAIAANVAVVCSAGNDASNTLRYPAAFDGVIGVGATLPDNTLTSYTNESNAVDIVAPGGGDGGSNIYTTNLTTHTGGGYARCSGTSYATPQVAATIAMMYSISDYDLSPAKRLTQLQNASTVNVKGWRNPGKTFKLLNAGKSVYNIK